MFIKKTLSTLWTASKLTSRKPVCGIGLKTISPKQTLQRLPIALAQVKVGNTSESFLNEIR